MRGNFEVVINHDIPSKLIIRIDFAALGAPSSLRRRLLNHCRRSDSITRAIAPQPFTSKGSVSMSLRGERLLVQQPLQQPLDDLRQGDLFHITPSLVKEVRRRFLSQDPRDLE